MTVGHLLCDQGVSGDLLLGALVDVGVPEAVLRDAVDGLGIPGVSVEVAPVHSPVAASRVTVRVPDTPRLEDLASMERLLASATLPSRVVTNAAATMRALATAEARVHGTEVRDVRFHELGSLDTIVDVVGICSGLAWLGLQRLTHGTVNVGSGSVRSDHGQLSVPAPAVCELLRDRVIEARGTRELTTPTGAASLLVHASPSAEVEPMRLTGAGRGVVAPSGSTLTLLIGEPVEPAPTSQAIVLEATMDDLEPQLVPAILDELRGLGAMDVWATDTRMKKGRAGLTITVLCHPEQLSELRSAIIRETPTLGVRWHAVQRQELARDRITTDVDGVSIRIKRGWLDGTVVNAHPEFDDVVAAARSTDRPLRDVYVAAVREASRMTGPSPRRPVRDAATSEPLGEDGQVHETGVE